MIGLTSLFGEEPPQTPLPLHILQDPQTNKRFVSLVDLVNNGLEPGRQVVILQFGMASIMSQTSANYVQVGNEFYDDVDHYNAMSLGCYFKFHVKNGGITFVEGWNLEIAAHLIRAHPPLVRPQQTSTPSIRIYKIPRGDNEFCYYLNGVDLTRFENIIGRDVEFLTLNSIDKLLESSKQTLMQLGCECHKTLHDDSTHHFFAHGIALIFHVNDQNVVVAADGWNVAEVKKWIDAKLKADDSGISQIAQVEHQNSVRLYKQLNKDGRVRYFADRGDMSNIPSIKGRQVYIVDQAEQITPNAHIPLGYQLNRGGCDFNGYIPTLPNSCYMASHFTFHMDGNNRITEVQVMH